MKHKIISLAVLLCISFDVSIVKAADSMFVIKKTGDKISYSVGNIRKLTFPTGTMQVSKMDGSIDLYTQTELKYFSFKDFTISSGISNQPNDGLSKLKLYPNPVVNTLYVSMLACDERPLDISIIDIYGKVVCKQTSYAANVLDIEFLPKGIYICKVQSGVMVEFAKFLKQ